ncbi:MAG: hypothetical protein QM756_19560 [Polyangiaceae bacterium]
MIESASERRLAGDFVGALAAARVALRFDLDKIEKEYGRELTRALEGSLLNLAPDLLRWHLPRWNDRIVSGHKLVLSQWHDPRKTLTLWLETPRNLAGPQDLTLHAGVCDQPSGRMLACQWDVRRAHELLYVAGGRERLPFFTRDARSYRTALGTADSPAPERALEPELHFEMVTRLQESKDGQARAAALCGIEFVPAGHENAEALLPWIAMPLLLDVARSVRGTRAAAGAYISSHGLYPKCLWLRGIDSPTPQLSVDWMPNSRPPAVEGFELPFRLCQRLPELDLIRLGALAVHELHPLVAAALFPEWRAERDGCGPALAAPVERLRARCGKDWHWLRFDSGKLCAAEHSAEQAEREAVLGALGAKVPGCFRALQAWQSGGRSGPEPKLLRLQRSEFRARVFHGDVAGVARMLQADSSLALRGTGRSLLHELPWLGPAALPIVIPLGLDLEQVDSQGLTPFQVALEEHDEAAQQALLAAGARRLPARKK